MLPKSLPTWYFWAAFLNFAYLRANFEMVTNFPIATASISRIHPDLNLLNAFAVKAN
jgi:hypothetical protein